MWRHNMYISIHLQPIERRLVARRQVCWLDDDDAEMDV